MRVFNLSIVIKAWCAQFNRKKQRAKKAFIMFVFNRAIKQQEQQNEWSEKKGQMIIKGICSLAGNKFYYIYGQKNKS